MNQLSTLRSQRGAILVIALMFLVLLTILGVSSMSGVTMEERMAGNLREQQTAFQAAESALRDAEIDLEVGIGGTGNRDPLTVASFAANNCSAAFTAGICRQPAAPLGTWQTEIVTAPAWDWTDVNKTVRYGTYTGASPLPGVNQPPRYVIEYLAEKDAAPTTRHFRITARGWGANANTTVTLQTVYRMDMN